MQIRIRFPQMSMRGLLIALACATSSASALAQWQWVDATGRKVYSDTAPPQSIPEKNILKRPGARAPVQAPAAAQEAGAKASGSTAPSDIKPASVDPKLEAKRKEAEAEEATKRKLAEDKMVETRTENCTRAKSAKATIELGTRIQTVNAKGEREFMDDAARATESKRLDGIIASSCGPLPSKSAASGSTDNERP